MIVTSARAALMWSGAVCGDGDRNLKLAVSCGMKTWKKEPPILHISPRAGRV
jgi:hypothetical protein